MNFKEEQKILDEVYSEIVDAIMNKPGTENYEEARIYFENAAARMNKWANDIKKVQSKLQNREETEDLSADNRPA